MTLRKKSLFVVVFFAGIFFLTFLAWHIADCLTESSLRYCLICEYAVCDEHAKEGMILEADDQIKIIELNGKGEEEIFTRRDLDRPTEIVTDNLPNQTIRFVCQEGNDFKRCVFWFLKPQLLKQNTKKRSAWCSKPVGEKSSAGFFIGQNLKTML